MSISVGLATNSSLRTGMTWLDDIFSDVLSRSLRNVQIVIRASVYQQGNFDSFSDSLQQLLGWFNMLLIKHLLMQCFWTWMFFQF